MISRRHVLQIAAASAAAAPSLSGLTRAQAARALDAPTAGDMPQVLDPSTTFAASDPATFAQETLRASWTDELAANEPTQAAEYYKARAALFELYPELRTAGAAHPFHQMDDAIHALWSTAHLQGVRVGAAAEHYRLAVVGPMKLCWPCQGVGIVKNAACRSCNGHGTVPVAVIQERGR